MPAHPGRVRATALAVIAAAAVLLSGCAGSAATPPKSATPPAPGTTTVPAGPATPVASGSAVPRAVSSPSVIAVPPPPGRLHQTRAFPSARSRVFRAEMTDLWAAIVTRKADLARQSFFPLAAYKQIKAIYNPAADWRTRLFGDFRLDVAAAHRFLGRGARHARLIRVIMPPAGSDAWIVPGVCDNAVGYWHAAGARLVYRQHGQLRSIGIASLISWRGRWYVVHFGAVLRTGSGGVVDSPASGPGVPGPPGGC